MISYLDRSWDCIVGKQAKGTFYYDHRWFELINKMYGYQIIPLTTKNAEGEVTGFLPLCSISSPLTGRRLVSLPFSDYCPLLAVDEASANNLIDQAIYLAKSEKAKYLELRTGVNDVLAKRSDLTESNLYVSWTVPLCDSADDLWEHLRKPVQKRIKKSQRLGVKVRVAQRREEMEIYYRIHLQTRSKKHGMPAQSKKYFFQLWDSFAADGVLRLLLAEYQGVPIAGAIQFASGDTIRLAYSASDERYLDLAPNNLLFWDAMMWGCTHGYKKVDLGRTACNNEGLMEFKRRWGATKELLPYYYYPQTFGLAATSESSWKYLLLTNVWRKLPLLVTAPLGGYLYKHLG